MARLYDDLLGHCRDMLALLQQLERDASLLAPRRFADRVDAIERLEEWLMPGIPGDANTFEHLHGRARAMLDTLEDANANVCRDVRDAVIRGDGGVCLRAWLDALGGPFEQRGGYGHADALVAGMFDFGAVRDTGTAPGEDMIFYQPTPARHVVAMIDQLALGPGDMLVDLGSGLGHVPMLANILTGASTVGIELQVPLVAQAHETAQTLGLHGVALLQGDARSADLSTGTVFYLYTPFKGAIMDQVLTRLKVEAKHRSLRIATFGPCTLRVGEEPWLGSTEVPGEGEVCVFHAR